MRGIERAARGRRHPVGRALALLTVGWMVVAEAPLARFGVVTVGAQAQATPASPAISPHRALLDRYCVTCHNARLRTGGLALDAVDVTRPAADVEVWEPVIRKLRVGAMPPPGRPRPDATATRAFVADLRTKIDRAAAQHPNPGRVETFHRLNRAEYRNAIRDLLAIDVDVASMLPADDSGDDGFDNIARMLSVSPTLLERYLSAARKISHIAVGVAPGGASIETYRGVVYEPEDELANASDDLPFGSRGGLAARHNFPVDGEYGIRIRLRRSGYDFIVGLAESHQLEIRMDGELVQSYTVGGEGKGTPAPLSFAGNLPADPEWEQYVLRLDQSLRVRVPVQAGPHVVGVSFVSRPTKAEGVKQRPESVTSVLNYENPYGNPGVESVTIDGPHNAAGASDTPSRRQLFVCAPTSSTDDESCARQMLSVVARRAYRRPVTDDEVERLLGFFRTGRRDGTFDTGIELALERVLVDPNFLFRIERDPVNQPAGTAYRISDLELASRLSFFLWSSIPDDELLDLAVGRRLREPAVLTQQVRRMLADPRSRALVENFGGQWLQLRNIAGVTPNARLYPEFDELLRRAFLQETELFIESTIREDRSVLDLLTADYTFVNERLARHYQIPDIYGAHFRRITFTDDARRGGVLAHGSLLTVTSYPNRTSPVLRGKWLLENILGAPTPPPPPNVPTLPNRSEGTASVRERLEQHRQNPVCATCHSQIDPLGFALENFDGVGKWRTTNEEGAPIDAKGAFPTGAEFEGLTGLQTFLLENRQLVVEGIVQKLLLYALGRELGVHDLPTVRRIEQSAASSDYRWSSLILGIVESTPFQMRMPLSQEATLSASVKESLR